MNTKALLAVLEQLKNNCMDDMADEKSEPEEKLADAAEDVADDGLEVAEEEDGAPMVEMAEEEEDMPMSKEEMMRKKLAEFMKPSPKKERPGTMAVIDVQTGPKKGKRSIKDLMNG